MKSHFLVTTLLVTLYMLSTTVATQNPTTSASTTKRPTPANIVGGSYASRGQFRFTLSLQLRHTYSSCSGGWWGGRRCTNKVVWKHICGAVLIGETCALSAKHCFRGKSFSNMRVKGGILHLSDYGPVSYIASVKYYANSANDFAHIELRSRISGSYVRAIHLPTGTVSSSACWVIGWGKTALRGSVSNRLKYSRVKMVQGYKCTRNYPWSLCARYATSSACHGDSGGPLACRSGGQWNLVGLVWYGNYPLCSLNSPNGYTKVSYFRKYISDCQTKTFATTTTTRRPLPCCKPCTGPRICPIENRQICRTCLIR